MRFCVQKRYSKLMHCFNQSQTSGAVDCCLKSQLLHFSVFKKDKLMYCFNQSQTTGTVGYCFNNTAVEVFCVKQKSANALHPIKDSWPVG